MIKSQITFKQLEAFVFIIDMGTFRAAATALGTTQPNISARISALETALDTTLLTRNAGSINLTENGEKLLLKARDVLWAGEAFIEEASRQSLIEETLRLGVTELVACSWLRDFLRLMKDAYPNLKIQLEVDISTAIDARLTQGYLDLALQTGPFRSSVFKDEPLGGEAYCWVANAAISKRLGDVPDLVALFDCTIITHAKHTQSSAALHTLAADKGLPMGKIVHSNALLACVPMALEGMGVALLPERLVASDISAGELHKVEAGWLPQPLSFFARFAPGKAPLYVRKAAGLAAQAMQLNVQ
ncbi:MAG: LysR family transcriptional regulator [Planktomarina sp.]